MRGLLENLRRLHQAILTTMANPSLGPASRQHLATLAEEVYEASIVLACELGSEKVEPTLWSRIFELFKRVILFLS